MTLIEISKGRTINPDKVILIYAEEQGKYYWVLLEGRKKELVSEVDYRKLKEGR